MNTKNATILIVTDTKEAKKYSLGTIIEDFDDKAKIKFDSGEEKTIDHKYIVINLHDVMQKEIIYSITNATSSIYKIHGIKIPEVTGERLYPSMTMHSKPFIPLMYNTAKKLYNAEEEFLKNNLTIKIYDTYRPYEITKYLYKIILNLTEKYYDYLNGEVNGHKYDQTDFLASKTSTHNYGIALDMTLVDLKTDKELEMQTKMHDLSIYSVTDYNNENANMFAEIMSKHGFHPLESEWWHFQDDDSKIDYMNYYIKPENNLNIYE